MRIRRPLPAGLCASPLVLVVALGACASPDADVPATSVEAEAERAWAGLVADMPGARRTIDGGRIERVYGRELAFGASGRESANRFVGERAALFGVQPTELQPVDAATGVPSPAAAPIDLMHDRITGAPKLSLYRYRQVRAGIPVYGADLSVVVRNEPRRPVVLAASTLRSLGRYTPPQTRSTGAFSPAALTTHPTTDFRGEPIDLSGTLTGFTEPEPVFWAGTHDEPATPTFAFTYVADNDGDPLRAHPLRLRVVADAQTGAVLHQESLIVFDVDGHVAGRVTEGDVSMECGPESPRAFRHASVLMTGGGSAYTDASGDYSIFDSTETEVDVISPMRGEFFRVSDFSGPLERLSLKVLPPETVSFLHNPTPDVELLTGQANGYSNADEIRDWVLAIHPTYPVIATQTDFSVNVNQTSGFCPGNAWYDGASINFCISSSQYGNTSFASVSHHEYGHHLVGSGGSGQGAYGEGMSDVIAILFADDPGLGYGFFAGDCENPLRTADNDCQFSSGGACSTCGSEVHDCGNLVSGAIWSTRKTLAVSEPADGLAILSQLVVNSILLHDGDKIKASIAVDLLTLDDDDANLDDGTPHRLDICEGFGAHGLDCPVLANYFGVELPASAAEDAGVLTGQGTVTLQVSSGTDTVVALASSDPSVDVPPQVTIPAGETSVAFDLTVVDDALLDGTRAVSVTASGDLQAGRAWIDVLDDETATLELSLPPSVLESETDPVMGMVTSDQPVDADITVTLSSNDTSEIITPVSVVIPAGQTSASFALSAVDDIALDGAQPVAIGATVTGWTGAQTSIDVLDDEQATIEFLIPDSLSEAAGTVDKAGRVRLGGTLETDLVVSLQSDDESELVLPMEVTVSAGKRTARFDMTAVDDDVSDGTIVVGLQALADGFTMGAATIDMLDDDAHHFVVTLLDPPPFPASEPFLVQAVAVTEAGEPMPAYARTATVSASAVAGPLPMPITDATFADGEFNGALQIDALAGGAVLHFEDAAGVAGDSLPFDVVAGPMVAFQVGDLPEVHASVPFDANVFAVDAHGFPAAFDGPATLSGLRDVPSVLEALVWFPNPSDSPRVYDAITRFFTSIVVTNSSTTEPLALAGELTDKHLLVVSTHGELSDLELKGLGLEWADTLHAFVERGGTLVVTSGLHAEHEILATSGLLDVESIWTPIDAYVQRALEHPLTEGLGFQFQTKNTGHTYAVDEPGAQTILTFDGDALAVSRDYGHGHVVLIGSDFASGTQQNRMDHVLANAAAWALSRAGTPIAIHPALITIAGGGWLGELGVATSMSNLTIVVDDGIGHLGRSAVFEVLP